MSEEVLWRLGWAAVVMCTIAYASYLFFGSVVHVEAEAQRRVVEVFDLVATTTNSHRLSGMLVVPTACHSISWETQQIGEAHYHVAFSSFGDVHGCKEEVQARAFRTIITDPPKGWVITASIDGDPLDIRIIRTSFVDALE